MGLLHDYTCSVSERAGMRLERARCACGWVGDGWLDAERAWEQWLEHRALVFTPDHDQALVLAHDGGVLRHHLAGVPVHIDDTLELRLPRGRWTPVRYHWLGRPDQPPRFFLALGGGWERVSDAPVQEGELVVPLDRASFRWPASPERRGQALASVLP